MKNTIQKYFIAYITKHFPDHLGYWKDSIDSIYDHGLDYEEVNDTILEIHDKMERRGCHLQQEVTL